MSDYIKINRSILEWEWWGDINTSRLFLYLLLKANWKEGKYRGTTVPRGSLVSSIGKLSEETNLTEREIRTAISHLKSTGEVTSKSTNKYTVFTVVNYDLYQTSDRQNGRPETFDRHSNDKLTTSLKIKRREEGKKERNKNTMCTAGALFERLWKLYPVKRGKGQVSDAAKERLLGIGFDEMERAIERYRRYVDSIDYLHYQNGSTFFNSGYVDYLDANYKPVKPEDRKDSNQFNQFPQRDYDFDTLEKELLSNQEG